MNSVKLLLLVLMFSAISLYAAEPVYPWLKKNYVISRRVKDIPLPSGYIKTKSYPGSYDEWLRNLPLMKSGSPVLLYNGKKKHNQKVHYAVLDIDTGRKDLQQCADAVMRLRAEYAYSVKRYSTIHFNFTSGDKASFKSWAEGFRPQINGNKVKWIKKAPKDYSYPSFRKYLDTVFMYAGSHSLSKELVCHKKISDIQIGDVFIQGGFPGHAVIVLDTAKNIKTGKKIFLLAQSYMPAQSIHILINPENTALSPWYSIDFDNNLITPEWTFKKTDLKYFK